MGPVIDFRNEFKQGREEIINVRGGNGKENLSMHSPSVRARETSRPNSRKSITPSVLRQFKAREENRECQKKKITTL